MSTVNPEAGQPTTTQAFEMSDRNPGVVNLGGTDADRGQTGLSGSSVTRVTAPVPSPSPNAGLQNYNIGDSRDSVEDEAEREG
jgi:hypothetical protein